MPLPARCVDALPAARKAGATAVERSRDDYDGLALALVVALGAPIHVALPGPRTDKACSKCGKVKSRDEFAREQRARDGRRADCLSCARASRVPLGRLAEA